jgi:hypothetical protein
MDKAVRALEADLRALWPQMQDLLENQLSPDLQKEARQNLPDFAGQRRDLSESIQAAFMNILSNKDLQQQLVRSYSRTAISLRAVVAIFAVAAAAGFFFQARNGTVSIGAFVLGGGAALLAIFLAFNHRRSVLRTYQRQLSPKWAEFSQNLEQRFAKAIDTFCADIAKKFQDLREICQSRLGRYEPQSRQAEELQAKLAGMKLRLG